jgi:hypothetical protein
MDGDHYATKKKWYVPAGVDLSHFSKWQTDSASRSLKMNSSNKGMQA